MTGKSKGKIAEYFEKKGFITKELRNVSPYRVYRLNEFFSLEYKDNIVSAYHTPEQERTRKFDDVNTPFDKVEFSNYQLTTKGKVILTGLWGIATAAIAYLVV